MTKPLAALINLNTNNILSIKRALEFVGFKTQVVNEYSNINKFDIIVLPGVGAFNKAMKRLEETSLIKFVNEALNKNKDFIGICLGMQLLFSESPEFKKTNGLSFFNEKIQNFENFNVSKKTAIGWNQVKFNKNFFEDEKDFKIFNKEYFYFVHSFFVDNKEKEYEQGTSFNGEKEFVSVIKKSNIVAFQFHPEKSGLLGLRLLKATTKKFFL
tara:strand:+ start:2247 stop:2885 length:639 start_codon:yes stop_codon:yes gene_type:complete